MVRSRWHHLLFLLVLWAGITALDLNKAFHIDDTFHLKAAQWIEQHPGTPMSGPVNWGYHPEPLHAFNQPPGFFYAVALTGHWFGWGEAPMHAMRSLFSLLALACFLRLALHRAAPHAHLLTGLFALCPAFLVNQGLMTDVPLLAMVLLFACLLLVPGRLPTAWRYALAALALGGALLIKYSALPLLVVFPLALALRREWRRMPLTLLPLVVLAAWSAWNLHEYGAIHLLDRKGGDPSLRGIYVRTLGFLTALGAVAPFTPVFLGAFAKNAKAWLLPAWAAALAVAAAFIAAVHAGWITEAASDQVLRIAFTLNGVLIACYAARYLPHALEKSAAETWTLAAWALGTALFICLFSPFVATRHVLLVLPPVLLLIAPALEGIEKPIKGLAVASTAALGILLALSDKAYADFYRREAPVVAAAMRPLTQGTVWNLGHWGWQWYAERAGMPTLAQPADAVAIGDVLVVPQDYDAQAIPSNLAVEAIASWKEPPSRANFFNVDRYAGMYTSGYGELPWSLCRSHSKVITAYRVVGLGKR